MGNNLRKNFKKSQQKIRLRAKEEKEKVKPSK